MSTKILLVIVIVAAMATATGFAIGFTVASDSASLPENCKPDCFLLLVNGTNYLVTGKSYQSYKECLTGNCALATVEGEMYVLKEDAFHAYQNMDNVVQLHMMKIDLQLLDDKTGYLISMEGHNRTEIERLVARYNISEEHSKLHPESTNWKEVYGLMFKKDLIRFLEENDARSLSDSSIMVGRVASFMNGEVTITNPFTSADHELAAAEYKEVSERELARIVAEEFGVTRIDKRDLVKATHQPDQSTPD